MSYSINTIRIFVEKWEESCNFYTNKLGLTTVSKNPSLGWLQVEAGKNVYLGIEQMNQSDTEFSDLVGRFTGISLETENIAESYKQLTEQDVSFLGKPKKQSWGGTLAHFKDCDNNILTLLELPKNLARG